MYATILKGNSCHNPPGQGGGQFCSQQGQAPRLTALDVTQGKAREEIAWREENLRKIISHYGLEELAKDAEDNLRKLIDASEVHIRRMTLRSVEDMLRRGGRMLTQFDTTTTSGAKNKKVRAQRENVLFGLSRDPYKDLENRPSYGYLQTKDDPYNSAGQYGRVDIKLKPSVRERVTYTVGDSLRVLEDSLNPGRVKNSGAMGIPTFQPVPLQSMNLSSMVPLRYMLTTSRGQDGLPVRGNTKAEYTRMFQKLAKAKTLSEVHNIVKTPYIEAQIHGQIRAGDIESITVPSGMTLTKSALNAAKKLGVKIVQSNSKEFVSIIKANPYHDPRTGRFTHGPGSGTSKDSAITPKMEEAIASARAEVLSYQDGKEHGVVVGPDGRPFFAKDGEASSIEFTKDEMAMFPRCVMVHNHPSGGSLSIQDILFAGTCQLAAVEAVSNDGVYRAIPNAPLLDQTNHPFIYGTQKLADSFYEQQIGFNVMMGNITPTVASLLHVDLIMESLSDLGFFKYERKSASPYLQRVHDFLDDDVRSKLKSQFFGALANSIKNAPEDIKSEMSKAKLFNEQLIPRSVFN